MPGPHEIEVFTYLQGELMSPLLTSVDRIVPALIAYVATPVRAASVLYVAGTGFLLMRGQGNADGMLGRMLTLLLVVWFCTDPGVYRYWVADLFLKVLPADLSAAVLSALNEIATLSASAFDNVWKSAYEAAMRAISLLGRWDWFSYIVVALFLVCAAIACGVSFAIWSLSFVIAALLVDIGPFIIPLALFKSVRSIFERWVGALLQCTVLQAFVLILLAVTVMVSGAMMGKMTSYTGTNPMVIVGTMFAAMIFFGYVTFIAWRLPALAASLAGGMHFSVEGFILGGAGAAASAGKMGWNAGRSAAGTIAAESRQYRGSRIPPSTGASLSNSATGPSISRANA